MTIFFRMFIIMYIKEGGKKGSHCKINNREKKTWQIFTSRCRERYKMGCGKYLHLGAEKFSTDTLFLVFHHTETLCQLSLELTSESKSFIICHHGTNKKEQIPWKCLIVVYSTSPKVCYYGGKGVGLLCPQKI